MEVRYPDRTFRTGTGYSKAITNAIEGEFRD
jgi:hypothetical protein